MSDTGNQDRNESSRDSSNQGELYRILFEESADAIFITDPQGKFVAVNPRGIELTGYSREELFNLNFTDLISPEDLARDPIRMDHLKQGKTVIKERRIRRREGSLLPVEITARMLPEGNLLGMVRDITERKKAEEMSDQRARELTALQALGLAVSASLSLERTAAAALRGMLEAVEPDLAFLFLREGDRLILQGVLPPEARQLLGAVPEHRVGECICGLAVREGRPIYSPKIHEDPRCTWEECKQAGIRSFAALPVRSGEEIIGVIGLASLTDRDFEARADFLETLAHQVSVALANAQLFEASRSELAGRQQGEQKLREIEEKYRRLVETTGTGYVILDDQGRVMDANQEYAQLTGRQELEEVIGHSVLEWTAPHDLERNATEVRKCLEQGFVRNLEIDYLSPSGQVIPIEINATLLPTADGFRILTLCRDITERRRADQALRFTQFAVDHSSDETFWITEDARFFYVNEQACRALGYSREELLQMSVQDIDPEVPRNPHLDIWRELRAKKSVVFESLHKTKSGIVYPVEIRSNFLEYGDREYNCAFAQDITERKSAEQALRQSEERLRLALKAANQGLYDLNVQTGEAQVSPEYATMLGYDPAEFHETNAAWIERLHPEDHEPVAAIYRDYIAGKIPEYRVEFRQRTQSGDWKWILSLGKIVEWDARGGPLRMLGTHTDITERKLAEEAIRGNEERLRSVVDSAPFGAHLYELDEHDQLVFCGHNRSANRILGVDNAQFHGKTIEEAFPPLTATEIPTRYKHVAATGKGFEVKQVDYDHGKIRGAFEVHAFQTAPRRMAAFFIDITERKRAEEEKDALQAQLLQAQKMESVGQLAGGVAHDFNNMLSAIIGHAELAMMQCTPADPIHPNLKAIQNAAQRSADLTRQLLAFARKQTVAPKVLDLNDTVAGMLKMLLRLIGENIDLVWMPGAALWPVKLDPSQIDQVLANLCVNARDAIAGVGKVTIETENIAFDEAYCAVHPGFACGEYVLLAVSDDGSGMTKEVLDHLFEPFFTTKEVGQGTGLGLAMVYGIVKQNEGFITVYSEPAKGTTFKIYLPRFAGETLEPTAESPAETPRGRGETVLLVEDEAAILNVGQGMLERLGYRVLTAATPGEALRQAKTHAAEIQLLITDVVMPEMNGRDLAKLIRDIRPGLKCLFISGYTADVIAHRGVLEEGVIFLQKPFSMKDLASRLRQALERD